MGINIDKLNISPSRNIEVKKLKENNKFSDNLNSVKQSSSMEDIKRNLESVKKAGERLVLTQNYGDISIYKNAVKEYLKSVVDNMYSLDKNSSFWEHQYYKNVKIVDDKLEDMTSKLLSEEKENIDIVSTVDMIQGLLIDMYR
ncbi:MULTISPECIES: YaaR family protein [unclassified Clostridioides]|uniref:YaaR family protein n=1 Tax=unclassified Clostridioides TaxID=2635829 RepID=UPI001D0C06C1|nr:YaaR family protein [Clostridioides sp. ES-S-0049-03]MCC0654164.1 YaaR family protein [Clostridioides sp. ES-S-0001-03]MCC0657944.1 YaaR family protein [Clostridioides sp. ES-S-0123-01]MCC0677201.1 YaaR family protein [Clostridioides sp. ES-W-0018-02]MCC0681683.1 YaaR family protein [Clostridioides sp. ES-S-0005-03]MCC0695943.1 YaaR family protein [Clostridioides sp. ES-S-0048-02]MCC0703777.1 YaaR family protein [Clostridioides sp. ES-S-0049-02]MCC0708800.1 YaaR family protein [Clostridio